MTSRCASTASNPAPATGPSIWSSNSLCTDVPVRQETAMTLNNPQARQPLAGMKVAVIVESQFIPQELRIYRERFESYGASVEFVSRLWGQPKQRFYSTVEPGVVDNPQYLEVS